MGLGAAGLVGASSEGERETSSPKPPLGPSAREYDKGGQGSGRLQRLQSSFGPTHTPTPSQTLTHMQNQSHALLSSHSSAVAGASAHSHSQFNSQSTHFNAVAHTLAQAGAAGGGDAMAHHEAGLHDSLHRFGSANDAGTSGTSVEGEGEGEGLDPHNRARSLSDVAPLVLLGSSSLWSYGGTGGSGGWNSTVRRTGLSSTMSSTAHSGMPMMATVSGSPPESTLPASGIPGPGNRLGMAGLHAGEALGGPGENGKRGSLSDDDAVQQGWERGARLGTMRGEEAPVAKQGNRPQETNVEARADSGAGPALTASLVERERRLDEWLGSSASATELGQLLQSFVDALGHANSIQVLHTQPNGSHAPGNGGLQPVLVERTMAGGLQLKLKAPSGVTLQLMVEMPADNSVPCKARISR